MRAKRQKECLDFIKKEILKDSKFVKWFKEESGVDLIEKSFNDYSENGGIDS